MRKKRKKKKKEKKEKKIKIKKNKKNQFFLKPRNKLSLTSGVKSFWFLVAVKLIERIPCFPLSITNILSPFFFLKIMRERKEKRRERKEKRERERECKRERRKKRERERKERKNFLK